MQIQHDKDDVKKNIDKKVETKKIDQSPTDKIFKKPDVPKLTSL